MIQNLTLKAEDVTLLQMQAYHFQLARALKEVKSRVTTPANKHITRLTWKLIKLTTTQMIQVEVPHSKKPNSPPSHLYKILAHQIK